MYRVYKQTFFNFLFLYTISIYTQFGKPQNCSFNLIRTKLTVKTWFIIHIYIYIYIYTFADVIKYILRIEKIYGITSYVLIILSIAKNNIILMIYVIIR